MDRVVKQHRGSAKTIIVVNQLYEEIPVPVTTSVKVAEVFEKEHFNVLRDIKTINNTLESVGGGALNFEGTNYLNKQNKSQPMFIMDRDAFSMLVFGFNGAKAMKFKMDYVRTFNELELELMKSKAELLDLTDITLALSR